MNRLVRIKRLKKKGIKISDLLLLDTNIHLGMFYANNKECIELEDFLLSDKSKWVVVTCPKLMSEIERNVKKIHMGVNLYYHHIIHRLDQSEKYKLSEESEKRPIKCTINHKNDIHLVNCALGAKCDKIITLDSRLTISSECGVEIIKLNDFLLQIMES